MRFVGLSALLLVGCSGGELEKVEADRDLLEARVLELESSVESLESEKKRLKAALEEARSESTRERERAEALAEAYEAMGITEDTQLRATVHTGLGDIRCELWPDIAPVTVRNFVGLSEGTREWTDPATRAKRTDPLYNGTVFHRVIKDFMIQGGDPLGTGRGGPGYRFEDEVYPDVRFDEPGLLAMANAGPGTNGSQFFITDSTPGHLNGKHTIFGKCELEVVRRIIAEPMEEGPRGPSSTPIRPVVIERIEIERG